MSKARKPTRTENRRQQLGRGKLCPCGKSAVKWDTGTWTCAGCLEKGRAIYATERIRSTCGFPGALDFYRVAGV